MVEVRPNKGLLLQIVNDGEAVRRLPPPPRGVGWRTLGLGLRGGVKLLELQTRRLSSANSGFEPHSRLTETKRWRVTQELHGAVGGVLIPTVGDTGEGTGGKLFRFKNQTDGPCHWSIKNKEKKKLKSDFDV